MAVTAWKTGGTATTQGDIYRGSEWGPFGKPGFTPANLSDLTEQAECQFSDEEVAGETGVLTNFGFTTADVPSGATIDGIEIEINACDTSGTDRPCKFYQLQLTLDSGASVSGVNAAPATSFVRNFSEDLTAGGAADTLGATLTPADIVSSAMGLVMNVGTATAGTGNTQARISQVRMRVHYTEGGGGPTTYARSVAVGGASALVTQAQASFSRAATATASTALSAIGSTSTVHSGTVAFAASALFTASAVVTTRHSRAASVVAASTMSAVSTTTQTHSRAAAAAATSGVQVVRSITRRATTTVAGASAVSAVRDVRRGRSAAVSASSAMSALATTSGRISAAAAFTASTTTGAQARRTLRRSATTPAQGTLATVRAVKRPRGASFAASSTLAAALSAKALRDASFSVASTFSATGFVPKPFVTPTRRIATVAAVSRVARVAAENRSVRVDPLSLETNVG